MAGRAGQGSADIDPSPHAIDRHIKPTTPTLKSQSLPSSCDKLNGMTSSPLSLSLRPSPSNEAASAEQYSPPTFPVSWQPPPHPAADFVCHKINTGPCPRTNNNRVRPDIRKRHRRQTSSTNCCLLAGPGCDNGECRVTTVPTTVRR